MLLAIVDRVEHILLDSHCLCTLYQSNFPFPIYRLDRFLGPSRCTIDNGVDSDQSRRNCLRSTKIRVDDSGAPVAEEVGGGGSGSNKAPDVIPFVEGSPDDLPSESSGGSNHQNTRRPHRRSRRQIRCGGTAFHVESWNFLVEAGAGGGGVDEDVG